MDKYKINYIFSEEQNINDIFIKVLDREIKKYIQMIWKNEKSELSVYTAFSLEGDKSVR